MEGPIDKEVELLTIEPLHTTLNGSPIVVVIEPYDLRIDNSFKIDMKPEGTFYGRAEPSVVYGGTTRSISLTFSMIKSQVLNGSHVVSSNAVTTNLLQQLIYPAYLPTSVQNTSVLKTAPFFRILYGDLIGDFKGGGRKGLTGYISNLHIDIGAGGGYGASGIGNNLTHGIGGVKIPIEYFVKITFEVLHEHLVGWYNGKFAGDGRNNWPLNTGVVIDSSAKGPGMTGGNPGASKAQAVPGSPAATVGKAAQGDGVKLDSSRTAGGPRGGNN